MKLMFSVDGVMRYETKAATKELHTDLSKIWDMDYLTTYGYVQELLSLKPVRNSILLVRGPHSGELRQAQRMPVDGSGSASLDM